MKHFCKYCGKEIKNKKHIFLGACESCRTWCSHCEEETTGESTHGGLCEDCEEERLEDMEYDEEE